MNIDIRSGVYHAVFDPAQYSGASTNITFSAPTPSLTSEESTELSSLEADLEVWHKQQKLAKFKELPTHIRQEIADEACMKYMYDDFYNVDESKFEYIDRINELKIKQGMAYNTSYYMGAQTDCDHAHNYKYHSFINEFNKKQILMAHAEATLEEEIYGDTEQGGIEEGDTKDDTKVDKRDDT